MDDRTAGSRGRVALRVSGRLALSLASVLLFGVYAARPELAFLAYVALLPWTLLYTDDRRPRVSSWYYWIVAPLVWMSLYPQIFRWGWVPAAVWGPLFGLYWSPFAPVLRRVHHRFRLPRSIALPIVWVAFEWYRYEIIFGHFDLYALGYAQARFPIVVQAADLVGVYGLTFFIAAWTGLLADAFFAWRDGGRRVRAALRDSRLRRSAAFVGALVVLVGTYGAFRVATFRGEPGPRIAVVQPNEPHTIRNVVGVHLAQVVQTEEQVAPGEADLIVWPENAIFDDPRRERFYLEDLAWLARRKDAHLLVGALGTPADLPGRSTNTAILVDVGGEILGAYDKQSLFPWTEAVPLDALLQRVSPPIWRLNRLITRMAWGFLPAGAPGDAMVLLDLPYEGRRVPFGTLICHENAYPPYAAEAGRLGARFLVNITSESDLGGPVQEQLLRIGILRAVENRAGYVRCGNTGISAFIGPDGRLDGVLVGEEGRAILDRGTLVERVVLGPGSPTLYARSRDAFAKLCVALSLALFAGSFVRRRPRRSVAVAVVLAALASIATGCSGARTSLEPAEALARGRERFEEDPAASLRFLRQACRGDDDDACREALPWASDAFLKVGRPEAGAEFFSGIAATRPALLASALGFQGLMHEKAFEFPEAERDYVEALAAGAPARFAGLLGGVRAKSGDLEGALEAYARSLEGDPGDVDVRHAHAGVLRRAGRLVEAQREIERILSRTPGYADAWNDLGRILLEQDAEAAAEGAFRRAADLDDGQIEARYFLARLALRAGDREAAKALLREIREIEATLGRGPRDS